MTREQISICRSIKNANGFISITLLVISPFLIALLFSTLVIFIVFLIKAKTAMSCRHENLLFQSRAQEVIKFLFKLNPQIQALRLELAQAQAALALAIAQENPPAIASAQKWIHKIKLEQKAILQLQTQTLSNFDRWRISDKYQNEKRVHAEILEFANKLSSFIEIKLISQNVTNPDLAIRPDSTTDKPPLYLLKNNFIHKQESSRNWSWSLSISNEKHWLSAFLKGNYQWTEACQASLKKNLDATLVH